MRLIILSLGLIILASCGNKGTQKQTTEDSIVVGNDLPTAPDTVSRPDTFFMAFGNEPFWAVYVIRDKKIVFHPIEGGDIEVPYVHPVIKDSITTLYTSGTRENQLTLTVVKKNCSDGMSDMVHLYAVDLLVNKTSYAGCGRDK